MEAPTGEHVLVTKKIPQLKDIGEREVGYVVRVVYDRYTGARRMVIAFPRPHEGIDDEKLGVFEVPIAFADRLRVVAQPRFAPGWQAYLAFDSQHEYVVASDDEEGARTSGHRNLGLRNVQRDEFTLVRLGPIACYCHSLHKAEGGPAVKTLVRPKPGVKPVYDTWQSK